jgi:RNA-directed DNA polymerase
MDKVHADRSLRAAFARVRANRGSSGVDHVTVEMFETGLDDNLRQLGEELRMGEYCPQAIRRHYIPKPGSTEKRPLGIPTVRDRVVQTALRLVLEPIFERDLRLTAMASAPPGYKDALRRVDELLKIAGFVVDADLKSFFDTIPHDRLLALVSQR